MAKKQLEEKRYKEELEAARVFEEFLETFQNSDNTTSLSKTWVRGNVYNPDSNAQSPVDSEANQFYKPSPSSILTLTQKKLTIDKARECARILPPETKNDQILKKKKSNLESFKEELELLHKGRIEKQNTIEQIQTICALQLNTLCKNELSSTNLFVNNIHMNMTESQLIDIFGKYGPIANVKIMWPRAEKDKMKTTNCGFVAYMSRKDAQRAMNNMNGKIVMDHKLEICWSKSILLPAQPIYIPQVLLELTNPLPDSGLPFNAQPPQYLPKSVTTFDEYLSHCIVQVVIPRDKHILALIHKTIEYIVREGPLFEALLMTKEINNRSFRFLFDNRSSEHVYYRWKLYTILQGESIKEWSTMPFRMFENGPIWKPPILVDYTQGMPEELINKEEKHREILQKSLSTAQRDHLEMLIHKLTPEKKKVAECLVFCMNHCQAYREISECIAQSLEKKSTSLRKIISRIYLLSDILYNCKQIEPSFLYEFQKYLPNIMRVFSEIYDTLKYDSKPLLFNRIMKIFIAWQYKKIFPINYLEYLHSIFTNSEDKDIFQSDKQEHNDSISINQSCNEKIMQQDDIEINKENNDVQTNSFPGFITSRWETVDPKIVESQAMTTMKWSEMLMTEAIAQNQEPCAHSRNISKGKQKKLREIEIRVLKYQDKLESDEENRKSNKIIIKLVEDYRKELLRKLDQKMKKEENKRLMKRNSR